MGDIKHDPDPLLTSMMNLMWRYDKDPSVDDLVDVLNEAAAEIERLRAEIDAVKRMHHRFHNGDADTGATICYGCGKRWPCPTITVMEEARRG